MGKNIQQQKKKSNWTSRYHFWEKNIKRMFGKKKQKKNKNNTGPNLVLKENGDEIIYI